MGYSRRLGGEEIPNYVESTFQLSVGSMPNKSPQQRRPSSQQHANEASSQDIPESQPIPDSAPENPSHEIEVGDQLVYNDEMHSINLPGETENTSHEFEVRNDEIHTLNIPSETESPFVEFEIGNDEVHHRNLPRNLKNPSHEVDVGHEDVQLVQVPFLREQRAVQQPPTSKKKKTFGLKRQVKTKHVATRKYRTRSTVGSSPNAKGISVNQLNLSEMLGSVGRNDGSFWV
nr:uncharacterized protein LOC109148764 isoform X2 [Ipomoea batatas]